MRLCNIAAMLVADDSRMWLGRGRCMLQGGCDKSRKAANLCWHQLLTGEVQLNAILRNQSSGGISQARHAGRVHS